MTGYGGMFATADVAEYVDSVAALLGSAPIAAHAAYGRLMQIAIAIASVIEIFIRFFTIIFSIVVQWTYKELPRDAHS
jgi:hypothetical protein